MATYLPTATTLAVRILPKKRDANVQGVPVSKEKIKECSPAPTLVPRLLRIAEAAHYIGGTVWAVRQLIWNKQIPYVRVGKRIVVDRGDLDKWIDRQRAQSGAAA